MPQFWKIFLFLLFGGSFLTAQKRTDFELRMQNSFLKLYENPDVAIHSAQEIRTDKTETPVINILTKANLLKGDYVESVKIVFEKSHSEIGNEDLRKILILSREFYELNFYEQADKIISQYLQKQEKSRNSEKDQFLYAQLFQVQAQNYLALKKYENARKSLTQSSSSLKNKSAAPDLILKENQLISATILFEKGQKEEARQIADSLLKDLQNNPRNIYLYSLTQQLRGNLFFEEQNYEEAINCLKNALLPLENINYNPLKENVYKDLSINYLVLKNNADYELYKKKSEEVSKLLGEQKKEARREILQLNTESIAEKSESLRNQKKMQFFLLLGISFLILLIAGYFCYREIQKAKNLARQIKFFRSINIPVKTSKETITEKISSKKPLSIPKETEEEILAQLEIFENSKNYLDNKMSLATLSAQLGTNTKYLSEIINKYKDKNFNTYINELRIKHVIQLLSTDRTYLQYKISYIAEIGGFTSHSAFTNVFKSVTGFSPNEYLQNLRNSE